MSSKPPPSEPSGEISSAGPPPEERRHHVAEHPTGKQLAFLSLAAVGVVYGDIGTSPLYSLKQAFGPSPGYNFPANEVNVYGVLSMMVWSLVIVVAIKYIWFILRADNRGEGGVMALLALLLQQERRTEDRKRRGALIATGLFGSALLYGDGMITPAISVLSALQGLEKHPATLVSAAGGIFSANQITIIALVILVAVFAVQRFGTAAVGGAFGPVMTIWFITIAVLGGIEITHAPEIFHALNPWYAVKFFLEHRLGGFVVLGAVVLVVTGAEALYADMGHFGRRPIRVAWFALVMPALLLNYFGQGALILRHPEAVANPFYALSPAGFRIPLTIIATAAAIIASQALISGAFSLTQQSMSLGYSPRMSIVHTSHKQAGQIYIPEVNTILMVGTLMLVVWARNADRLASAYGIAVTGTMAITSILYYVVATTRWNWSKPKMLLLTGAFLALDLAFFGGNAPKILEGGWIPIAIAVGVYTLMSTWKRGRVMLTRTLQAGSLPLDLFLQDVERRKPPRVPGTAVFMTSSAEGVPVVLLHHLKHNKVLHEEVVLMSVVTTEVPEVPPEERLTVERLEHGFFRVTATYGFMEQPNVPAVLKQSRPSGIRARSNETTFYLGRERIILAGGHGSGRTGSRRAAEGSDIPRLARWRKKIFVIMSRNARSATEFFGIPPNRVVELGAQVEF